MSNAINHSWNFVVKTPVKEEKSIVTFKSEGNVLTGTMNSPDHGLQEIFEGTVDGNTLSWKSKVTKPMRLTLTYTATLDDAMNMVGSLKVGPAKMKFSGTLV
jgi:hypothetical protein